MNEPPDWSRPSTWKVCVRGPQAGSGFSFTTIELMLALDPRLTVSVFGYPPPLPSQ